MTISASIPVAQVDAANATLEAQGFGPDNFSVPLRQIPGKRPMVPTGPATHAALHSWDNPAFLAALQAIPGVIVTHTPGETVNFPAHVGAAALDWSDPELWLETPVMEGDTRVVGGVTWVSLRDFNVWLPPVHWRAL